ncbi:MAG: phage holin family protein [Anaerolineales bacterium]|nr:phage holin family protein [Anaerolineales bacterium]MCB9127469.1 phage holin family protein [Ardenticatenales bacterium]MCB9172198.1 phage holin family protein [Ardenticatenales bacterium]
MTLLIRLLINAVALWVAGYLIEGIQFGEQLSANNPQSFLPLLGVALIFGLVNAIIRPILKFFSFPLVIITLGLFTFVINALMLLITSAIAGSFDLPFAVDGFMPALLGSLVISIVSVILSKLLIDDDDK